MNPKTRNIAIALALAGGIGAWLFFRSRRSPEQRRTVKQRELDAGVKAIRSVGDAPIATLKDFVDVYGPVDRYTVQASDTLASLAKKFYGTESMGWFLFDVNRTTSSLTDPEGLKIGAVLLIPKKYPDPAVYLPRYEVFALWEAAGRKGAAPVDAYVFTPIALEGQKLRERK